MEEDEPVLDHGPTCGLCIVAAVVGLVLVMVTAGWFVYVGISAMLD